MCIIIAFSSTFLYCIVFHWVTCSWHHSLASCPLWLNYPWTIHQSVSPICRANSMHNIALDCLKDSHQIKSWSIALKFTTVLFHLLVKNIHRTNTLNANFTKCNPNSLVNKRSADIRQVSIICNLASPFKQTSLWGWWWKRQIDLRCPPSQANF